MCYNTILKEGDFMRSEYLDIKDREGALKRVKVVLKYKDDNSKLCYMVYEYEDEYFACKYKDILGEVEIDTDLTSEELEALQKLCDKMGDIIE